MPISTARVGDIIQIANPANTVPDADYPGRHTAIVIDNGTMVFAKTGDRLSNGYSVVRVDEMSITLVDAAGVTQTLRLP